MSVISYLLLIFPLKVLHFLHRVLDSYSFGYVTGSYQRIYPLCHVPLRVKFDIPTSSGRLVKIKWFVYMSKSQRSLCVSFSGTDVGLCIYHLFVWSNFNILHNCGSLYSPCRVLSYTLSVVICCIRLLCGWWFRLYHHITYICCFVAYYLFLLWYDWSL